MRGPAKALFYLWASTSFLPSAHAFAPVSRHAAVAPPSSSTARRAEGEPKEGTKLISNKKEIAYDGTRFFETGLDEDTCIPSQEFCVIDPDTSKPIRLTLEEKERMFLDALQSYYVSGRQVMDDAEFDSLKEDLTWNGSEKVNLNRKEVMYLEAMQAFFKGKPIMSDEEYDALKADLKEDRSSIAVSKEPKCYIDTGICTATFQKDEFRNNLLYLPAVAVVSLLWLGVGFEIIGGRINPLVLGAFGAPVIGTVARYVTDNFIFQNNLVAYGPCPTCEKEQRVYFGDILGVEGFKKQGNIKCDEKTCKVPIIVQRNSLRASTLPK